MSRILVVDDDKNINILIQSLLKNENYEVVAAFDGEDALKKNIEFEIECPHAMVSADEELMSEVWINLLNNGIKFTPCDSKIYVSIKKDAENIEVIIKDSGIGIKEEEQKLIFERFYMGDKSRKR